MRGQGMWPRLSRWRRRRRRREQWRERRRERWRGDAAAVPHRCGSQAKKEDGVRRHGAGQHGAGSRLAHHRLLHSARRRCEPHRPPAHHALVTSGRGWGGRVERQREGRLKKVSHRLEQRLAAFPPQGGHRPVQVVAMAAAAAVAEALPHASGGHQADEPRSLVAAVAVMCPAHPSRTEVVAGVTRVAPGAETRASRLP